MQFIWLLGDQRYPDHCCIACFRSVKNMQKAIEGLFYQYAALLERKGITEHAEEFIDGTKLESRATRYTFVWRKTVEKQLAKIMQTAKEALSLQDGNMTQRKLADAIARLDGVIADGGICVQRGRGNHKPEIVRRRDQLAELYRRWLAYERKRAVLGEGRNSFSKTDEDATFMHTKEDPMRNGQLKPCYNVQFAVYSGFITVVGVYSNRTDYGTLVPFLTWMEEKHHAIYERVVADSGYESLGNHRWLAEHGQQAFIKPNNYASKRTNRYRTQIGRTENMKYNETENCFMCRNGRRLDYCGTFTETSKSGDQREISRYRCEYCTACPYRSACCKARDADKPKEVVL